jgi:hypothetical protein
LNGATVQGRAIVVNKSEPKPEGERRSFNNNSRGGDSRGGYGGGNSRGGKPWWWKQRRILISHSTTIKKRCQCKLTPFIYISCKKYLL